MELQIQQPCPSCGAAITLNEDDNLIQCEYCDVHNFRVQQRLPRYVLPAKLPQHVRERDLLYIPYLRFKGGIYYCQGLRIKHKLIDTTRVGAPLKSMPLSLGLRPQAMKVMPVAARQQGRYIRQTVKAEKMLIEAARLTTLLSADNKSRVVHRAFIGETISRIYLPVYVHQGEIFDGVTRNRIDAETILNSGELSTVSYRADWEPKFLSTVCPGCGDVMQGSRDTLVLYCANCESSWMEEGGRFVSIAHLTLPAGNAESTHMPFWYFTTRTEGFSLNTLADFLSLTNQPIVIRRGHSEEQMHFLVPAFKLTPNTFLNTAKNMTLLQTQVRHAAPGPLGRRYPVTLSHSEAMQALKSVLAASSVNVKRVMELLPSIRFRVKGMKLLYLPFHYVGHDWVEQYTGVSISSAHLRFGRTL